MHCSFCFPHFYPLLLFTIPLYTTEHIQTTTPLLLPPVDKIKSARFNPSAFVAVLWRNLGASRSLTDGLQAYCFSFGVKCNQMSFDSIWKFNASRDISQNFISLVFPEP